MVDNCYGEFVEAEEPGHAGADLTVGSLIKNPGGGLAETGGYLAGKKELVANACDRAAGAGAGRRNRRHRAVPAHHVPGALFGAPFFVGQALVNARFAAALAESLGYEALPRWDEERFDLVQAIKLNSAQAMIQFCQTIQAWSPVDSFAAPIPGAIPGYAVPVVMAAGTFIQGASLELSRRSGGTALCGVLQRRAGVRTRLIAIYSAFAALREE